MQKLLNCSGNYIYMGHQEEYTRQSSFLLISGNQSYIQNYREKSPHFLPKNIKENSVNNNLKFIKENIKENL